SRTDTASGKATAVPCQGRHRSEVAAGGRGATPAAGGSKKRNRGRGGRGGNPRKSGRAPAGGGAPPRPPPPPPSPAPPPPRASAADRDAVACSSRVPARAVRRVEAPVTQLRRAPCRPLGPGRAAQNERRPPAPTKIVRVPSPARAVAAGSGCGLPLSR